MIRSTHSTDLLYSMVTIVNNTALKKCKKKYVRTSAEKGKWWWGPHKSQVRATVSLNLNYYFPYE